MKRNRIVKNYLNMSSKSVSKMSDKELRHAVTVLNSAANKRIKRVYTAGLSSDKIDKQLESGKFSVAGIKSRAALENAFVDVSNFLQSKTTSVRGIRNAQNKTFKNLAEIVNKELPKREQVKTGRLSDMKDQKLKNVIDMVWTQVDKISEDKSLGITKSERYRLAARAYNVVTRSRKPIKSKDELFSNLTDFYNKNYKKSIKNKPLTNLTPEEQRIAENYTNIT